MPGQTTPAAVLACVFSICVHLRSAAANLLILYCFRAPRIGSARASPQKGAEQDPGCGNPDSPVTSFAFCRVESACYPAPANERGA
jgi:hypothetical protein